MLEHFEQADRGKSVLMFMYFSILFKIVMEPAGRNPEIKNETGLVSRGCIFIWLIPLDAYCERAYNRGLNERET